MHWMHYVYAGANNSRQKALRFQDVHPAIQPSGVNVAVDR